MYVNQITDVTFTQGRNEAKEAAAALQADFLLFSPEPRRKSFCDLEWWIVWAGFDPECFQRVWAA